MPSIQLQLVCWSFFNDFLNSASYQYSMDLKNKLCYVFKKQIMLELLVRNIIQCIIQSIPIVVRALSCYCCHHCHCCIYRHCCWIASAVAATLPPPHCHRCWINRHYCWIKHHRHCWINRHHRCWIKHHRHRWINPRRGRCWIASGLSNCHRPTVIAAELIPIAADEFSPPSLLNQTQLLPLS